MNIGKFCPLPLCTLIGNFRICIYIYIYFFFFFRIGSGTTGSTGSQGGAKYFLGPEIPTKFPLSCSFRDRQKRSKRIVHKEAEKAV